MDKIDFVLLWVDGNDPAWQAEKARYQVVGGQDAGTARYREWGNLRYWFRAVEQFAPWVNRVHLVTWGHLPAWLNTRHPKLRIVNHRDFIPEEYLPTFNANPSELNIHRIPELTERFVYFNDDMFLLRPVRPEDFFQGEWPKDRFLLEAILPDEEVFKNILYNNVKVINKHFDKMKVLRKQKRKIYTWKNGKDGVRNVLLLPWKKFSGFHDDHLPLAFRKETFEEVWQQEPELLAETCRHRFRSDRDVSAWLMRYWALASGHFVPKRLAGYYDNICLDSWRSPDIIRKQSRKMLCCNDVGDCPDFETRKAELIRAFESILPAPSTFEKQEAL